MSKFQKVSSAINSGMIKAQVGLSSMRDNFRTKMTQKRRGAVSFEYIIIVVMMVGIIMVAWNILGPAIEAKVQAISNGIKNATYGSNGGNGFGK